MVRISIPLPSRTRLEEEYQSNSELWERALFELHRLIKVRLAKAGLHPTIKYRVKSFDSYYQKILRRVSGPDAIGGPEASLAITDLIGVRIVCAFMADLPVVERILLEDFEIVEREKKGAEFSFKEFGYESTHYLLKLPEEISTAFSLPANLMCEVQLRTILQDAWAEVEHELVYKSDYTPFDESLRRKLAALNANLSLADMIFHEIREYQRELQRQLRKRRADFWDLVRKSEDEHRERMLAEDSLLDSAAWGYEDVESGLDGEPGTASEAGNGFGGEVHAPNGRDHAGFTPGLKTDTGLNGAAAPEGDDIPGLNGFGHYDAVDGQLLKALRAHNAHHYDHAIRLYTAILDMQPRAAVLGIVLVHRGMAHFAIGHYHDAIEDFTRSLDVEGDHRKALYYRAVALRQMGNYAGALEDLNHCLDVDPYQPEALLSRAQTLLKLGDCAAAMQDVDATLSLNPRDKEAKRFRQVVTARLGM